MPDLSFGTLLILVECNYSGCTENLIAATATMAAARQTAAAMLYPNPGLAGTLVAPQPAPFSPDLSTPEAPTRVIPPAPPTEIGVTPTKGLFPP